MKLRTPVALVVALGVGAVSLAAFATVRVDRSSTMPCNRDAAFARTIYAPPSDTGFYFAQLCETVFADTVTVVLPPTGTVNLKRVTVHNVGMATVPVVAQGTELIEPFVSGYTATAPQVPILQGDSNYLFVHPHESVTLIAFPGQLPGAWFMESRLVLPVGGQ